eukprot:5878411-Prymnesium_polylepis.2
MGMDASRKAGRAPLRTALLCRVSQVADGFPCEACAGPRSMRRPPNAGPVDRPIADAVQWMREDPTVDRTPMTGDTL